jgi:hypothetical protein
VAIKGLTGKVRAPREAKLKLGYIHRGPDGKPERFPRDSDVFIAKVADGVTPEMVAAYGAVPVPDAVEAGVYNFGRELRGMLKFDFDLRDADGEEVVFQSLNRAWGQSRIRCSGDGGDGGENIGEAWVRDPKYRARLEQAGLLLGERPDGSGGRALCKGRDCELHHSKATKADTLPACHRETRFRFMLLTPVKMNHRATLDQQDPEYLRQLGWVEIATGSWHGVVDMESGMRMIQAETGGKTAGLPFTVRRLMRSISTPTGRVNKATLMVASNTDEVLTFAVGGTSYSLLRPAIRRQMIELAQAERALGLPSPTFADVADIQPQQDRLALTAPRVVATPEVMDRDQAIDRGLDDESSPAFEEAPVAVQSLGQDGRDELKRLCGGVEDANGRFSELERFRELVKASYQAIGVPKDPPGDMDLVALDQIPKGDRGGLEFLTTAHAEWIRAHHEEPAATDRDPDDEPVAATQGELLDARSS